MADIVVVVASRTSPSGPTLGDLVRSEFFGMWREREDIVDSEAFARRLREVEVASALRKAVNAGRLTTPQAVEAMGNVLTLNIECLRPIRELHEKALPWVDRLGQSRTDDAQYLAVAEQMGLPLWTADQRLVKGTRQVGVPWVHWIEEA